MTVYFDMFNQNQLSSIIIYSYQLSFILHYGRYIKQLCKHQTIFVKYYIIPTRRYNTCWYKNTRIIQIKEKMSIFTPQGTY